jgi:hypothetical protein
MPRGLDLTATQTLSTARFRAILVYDDLHYPFDVIGDPGKVGFLHQLKHLELQIAL